MTLLGTALIASFSFSCIAIATQFVRQLRTGKHEPTSSLLTVAVLLSILLLLIQVAMPRLQIALNWFQSRVADMQIP